MNDPKIYGPNSKRLNLIFSNAKGSMHWRHLIVKLPFLRRNCGRTLWNSRTRKIPNTLEPKAKSIGTLQIGGTISTWDFSPSHINFTLTLHICYIDFTCVLQIMVFEQFVSDKKEKDENWTASLQDLEELRLALDGKWSLEDLSYRLSERGYDLNCNAEMANLRIWHWNTDPE